MVKHIQIERMMIDMKETGANFLSQLEQRLAKSQWQNVFIITERKDGIVLIRNKQYTMLEYERAATMFIEDVSPSIDANGYRRPQMYGKNRDSDGNFVLQFFSK